MTRNELNHLATILNIKPPTDEELNEIFEALRKPAKSIPPIPTALISPRLEGFKNFARDVHSTAVASGWWDKLPEEGTSIALMHSELSEALEALRAGNPPDDKIPAFNGVEAELADVIIRILDFAEGRGYRVIEALEAKAAMNKTREPMHGGKKF